MKSFLTLLLLAFTTILSANDAAMNDGASGPEPVGWRSGQESIVQMKREALDIHFGTDTTHVLAKFTFLSHKEGGTAVQKLGFPNSSRSQIDGDISGPIENLVTRVNGEKVESELVEGWFQQIVKPDGSIFYERKEKPAPGEEFGLVRKYAWHVIEVEFPEGEEVVVEREYDCPSGLYSVMAAFFIYETRTGGAWKNDIEELVANVTFDDSVRTDLVVFTPRQGWEWNGDRTAATLRWENFEPRTNDDRHYFEVSVLDVPRIEELLKENPGGDFPPLEEWIEGWRKQHEAR